MKLDIVKFKNGKFGIKARFYVYGFKLYTEYIRITTHGMYIETMRYPKYHDENFETHYTGSIDDCSRRYGELIEKDFNYLLKLFKDRDLSQTIRLLPIPLIFISFLFLLEAESIIIWFWFLMSVYALFKNQLWKFIVKRRENNKAIRIKNKRLKNIDLNIIKFENEKYGIKLVHKLWGIKSKPTYLNISYYKERYVMFNYWYEIKNPILIEFPEINSEYQKKIFETDFQGSFVDCQLVFDKLIAIQAPEEFLEKLKNSINSRESFITFLISGVVFTLCLIFRDYFEDPPTSDLQRLLFLFVIGMVYLSGAVLFFTVIPFIFDVRTILSWQRKNAK